jgi:hypothetical protein
MSLGKISRIIDATRHERYRFSPARRVFIPKRTGSCARHSAQPVVADDAGDGVPVEPAAFAAGEAAVVEDVGDFGVGVGVEQLVNGG